MMDSRIILVLDQDQAQTLAAYIRLHPHPGPLMGAIGAQLEREIQEGLERELLPADSPNYCTRTAGHDGPCNGFPRIDEIVSLHLAAGWDFDS
jgi:hypothetical protein